MSSLTAIGSAFEEVTGWFISAVTTVSDPSITQWFVIGIGLALLGALVGVFKSLIWGA